MKKREIEYRYYEIPTGHYVLALLGEKWEMYYGASPATVQHFHNYLEVGYCYWGNGELEIKDQSYHYSGALTTIIPQNIPHTTTSVTGGIDKWEFLFIDIESYIRKRFTSGRYTQEELIKLVNRRAHVVNWNENSTLALVVKGIIEEYRTQKPHYKEAVNGYLRALIVEILRMSEDRHEEAPVADRKLNQYIDESVSYIWANYTEDLKVADIAMRCGLSESHFRKVFERSLSMKPLDYLNMVRVDKACALLEQEEYSVEEIGIRVGYQTPTTFTRNFKKLTGMSPLQWRKEASEKDGMKKNYRISAKRGW